MTVNSDKRYKTFSTIKPIGRCLWCGKEFPKNKDGSISKRKKYCSDKCYTAYYEHNNPVGVRNRLMRERGGKCKLCGYARDHNDFNSHPLAVHHKKPISDGGDPFPPDDGYELLCRDCHGMRHREINARKRRLKNKSMQMDFAFEEP